MASLDRLLKAVYNSAEKARRTNLEIKKIYDEQLRLNKL